MKRTRQALAALLATGVAAVLAAMLAAGAAPALAHTGLVAADPADGSTLRKAPQQVQLTFTEPPLTRGTAMAAVAPDGSTTTLAPHADGVHVTAPWPAALEGGRYRINWRVVAGDGHPLTGTLSVTIEAAAGPTRSPSPSAAASAAAPQPTPSTAAASDGQTTSGSVLPWLIGGVVVLAGAVAAGLVLRRDRSG